MYQNIWCEKRGGNQVEVHLWDDVYVQDAVDNSKYNGYGDKLHLAHNAEVFLGTPRHFNLGLSVNF
jgi:hypothetical protein